MIALDQVNFVGFILRTDTSNEGFAVVLFQKFENESWPVAYASR
jgi:hypothetical protein